MTADGELVADKARLPREVIARGATVAATAKSAALGRQLDPAAYLMHRAWVKTMVLLVLDDPDDPTPYWLVSTRHPRSGAGGPEHRRCRRLTGLTAAGLRCCSGAVHAPSTCRSGVRAGCDGRRESSSCR